MTGGQGRTAPGIYRSRSRVLPRSGTVGGRHVELYGNTVIQLSKTRVKDEENSACNNGGTLI